MNCPRCGAEFLDETRFCSACGADTFASSPTIWDGAPAAQPAPARISHSPAQRSPRYLPGIVIAERYRIVAQVGRGGMGEVYRADDLRLGQTVALKFLPESVTHDSSAIARLNHEVRLARQVSHPNVCRVFDVGEADGVPFISMEFVDGEDLGSLLHRIGHLPQEKGVQIAHQLCAGLAEAHAFGVLHRDLKPANVMLDGRGSVRITDFGLAATAEELTGEDAFAGTPAYMAPEQLTGQPPSAQSDLYALGLILYELFSGKEAYHGATITEILAERQKGAPAKISSSIKGLDPAIERAIFHCLQHDPQSRPRSALAVAAELPGGDPLAAAIAAGETPSPEMVAAATDQPLIAVAHLWFSLAVLVACIIVCCLLWPKGTLVGLVPVDDSPEAMASRAHQLVRRLGYLASPADTAYWYEVDEGYVRYRASRSRTPELAKEWRSAVPTPVRFIYRQSPQSLVAARPYGSFYVSLRQPADNVSGMITIVMDAAGRLSSFTAVPSQIEPETAANSPINWEPLLSEAGVDRATLTPVTPQWLPPTGFDSRTGWEGSLGGEPVQIVAAGYRGVPVYFRVVSPWTRAEMMPSPRLPAIERIRRLAYWVVEAVLVMIAALFLARRNLRSGRGDRKGATRTATTIFIAALISWLFGARHVDDAVESLNYIGGVGGALYAAAYVYLGYLAVEPYVRRRWPSMLVSWTRVQGGRFTDPIVGRDLLAGCLGGVLAIGMVMLCSVFPTWFDIPGQAPYYPAAHNVILRGWAGAMTMIADSLESGLINALGIVVLLLLARLIVRRTELAIVLFLIVAVLMASSAFKMQLIIALPLAIAVCAIYVTLLFRFGILALAVAEFTNGVFGSSFLTTDPARWYFWQSLFVLGIVAAIAIHGFRAALAGRPAFGTSLLED